MTEEQFFQGGRLADQAAYARVAEHPDEFTKTLAIDVGVQRGPFQSGSIGYWVDEACAGKGYVPFLGWTGQPAQPSFLACRMSTS